MNTLRTGHTVRTSRLLAAGLGLMLLGLSPVTFAAPAAHTQSIAGVFGDEPDPSPPTGGIPAPFPLPDPQQGGMPLPYPLPGTWPGTAPLPGLPTVPQTNPGPELLNVR